MSRFNPEQKEFIEALNEGGKTHVRDALESLLLWGINNAPAMKEDCRHAWLGHYPEAQSQRLGWALLRIRKDEN